MNTRSKRRIFAKFVSFPFTRYISLLHCELPQSAHNKLALILPYKTHYSILDAIAVGKQLDVVLACDDPAWSSEMSGVY